MRSPQVSFSAKYLYTAVNRKNKKCISAQKTFMLSWKIKNLALKIYGNDVKAVVENCHCQPNDGTVMKKIGKKIIDL